MELKLTDKEKLYLEAAERVVAEWREVMELDPIWDILVDIIEEEIEGAKGAVNIGGSQYYKASILLGENLFDLDEEEFLGELNDKVVPHELMHLVAVDFFRTALTLAGENEHLKQELRYRYEQFVVRTSKIITKLRNENLRLKYELKRASAGTEG
jgi:hypothetical protein